MSAIASLHVYVGGIVHWHLLECPGSGSLSKLQLAADGQLHLLIGREPPSVHETTKLRPIVR